MKFIQRLLRKLRNKKQAHPYLLKNWLMPDAGLHFKIAKPSLVTIPVETRSHIFKK